MRAAGGGGLVAAEVEARLAVITRAARERGVQVLAPLLILGYQRAGRLELGQRYLAAGARRSITSRSGSNSGQIIRGQPSTPGSVIPQPLRTAGWAGTGW